MRLIRFIIGVVFLCQLTGQDLAAQSAQEKLKEMRSKVIEQINGTDFYIHTIKRGQTLYMISKAYGVEVNEIIRDNPEVKDGIKADQTIRIPLPGQKIRSGAIKKPAIDTTTAESKTGSPEIPVVTDTVVVPDFPCGQDTTLLKPVYRVALMLPLFLSGVDKIDVQTTDPEVIGNINSFRFLPFYEGFMMALDSLEKQGLNIRLYVYDVGKDTVRTRQLLKKPEMKSMDLIFGVLYHANFKMVASFAKKHRIYLVNPISERSELITGNPYVIKVQPPVKSQIEQLAGYMSSTFTDGQVMIIRNGQYADRDAPERLRKACLERNLDVLVVNGQEAAIGLYAKDKENFVVVFSDNQAHVLNLLKGLYQLHLDYPLTLIGLPSWPSIDGMEIEYLVSLKTHMMAKTFVDYDDPIVKWFVRGYQAEYKTDPGLLAFQGFDQGYYFLSALKTYGSHFGRCLPEFKKPLMVFRFNFSYTDENGYENSHWRIYRYENYKLMPVF